ncbi:MAG: hypothetical protein H6825_07165 [Planctomycetes bacterium]|nr:hypothetical protein [Planctomycetota bacterium]
MFVRRVVLLAALASCPLAACAGHPLSRVDAFPQLKHFSNRKEVWAEARFYTDHARTFGVDLVADYGIVPVALKIGTVGEIGGDPPRVYMPEMQLRMFLPDGTALAYVPADQVPVPQSIGDRILKEKLELSLLHPWSSDDARWGYVFFALPDREHFVSTGPTTVVHETEPLWREMSLADGLVSFVYTSNQGDEPVNLGLQTDSH